MLQQQDPGETHLSSQLRDGSLLRCSLLLPLDLRTTQAAQQPPQII